MASEPQPRLRAAVVGTGGVVTGSHLPALRAHAADVELLAAVDVDQERLGAFCAEAGQGVAGYLEFDVMLAEQRLRPRPHRHATLLASAADCDRPRARAWVLCEKPLCLSLEEYDEIAAAEGEDAEGPYASVVFQHRY